MEKGIELYGLMCPQNFICLVSNGIDFGCCGKNAPTKKQLRQEKAMSKKQMKKLMKQHAEMMKRQQHQGGPESESMSGVGKNKHEGGSEGGSMSQKEGESITPNALPTPTPQITTQPVDAATTGQQKLSTASPPPQAAPNAPIGTGGAQPGTKPSP